ncbi:MAG: carbohydrate ABC transporter permease [Actinomycetota bacterium]
MVVLLVGLIFCFPLLVMLIGSLRLAGLPPPRTLSLSWPPAFENYARLDHLAGVWRAAGVSLLVVGIAVPIALVVASWAGFAIARTTPRMRAAMLSVTVAALLVPPASLLVGRFWLFRRIGVIDTLVPLVVPALLGCTPIVVLLYAWGFSRVPQALYDVCRIEGRGVIGGWRATLPLVRPVTVVVAALAFLVTWGDLLGPLVYVFDDRLATLPLALRELATLDPPQAPLLLAGAVIATVPVVVVLGIGARLLAESRGRV